MDGLNKIRATTAQDLLDIPTTVADVIVVVDRDTPIVNGTVPMPIVGWSKQWFILSTKIDITNLTMNSGGKTIHGNVTSLAAGTAAGWIYDEISDSWFSLFNTDPRWGRISGLLSNQTDLQAALDAKLSASGNGSALTGLTKTQVGLANVDNTSDASKPISTATQTALNAKQATLVSATNVKTINGSSILGAGDLAVNQIASVQWARVAGSNATTTGQALVDITGLTLPLVANAVYEVEAHLSVSTSAVTTGTAYGINYSAAGATVESTFTGSASTTTTKTLRVSAFNSATVIYLAGSAQTGGVIVKGIVTTGANAGNLTLQHLKLTSGTSTVFINSFIKTIRIS